MQAISEGVFKKDSIRDDVGISELCYVFTKLREPPESSHRAGE